MGESKNHCSRQVLLGYCHGGVLIRMSFDPSDIELEPLRPADHSVNFSPPLISEMPQERDTESAVHDRRSSFDHLLLHSPPSSDSGSDSDPIETDRLLDREVHAEPRPAVAGRRLLSTAIRPRAFFIRSLALLCVCSLGIGSH